MECSWSIGLDLYGVFFTSILMRKTGILYTRLCIKMHMKNACKMSKGLKGVVCFASIFSAEYLAGNWTQISPSGCS